MHYSKWANSGVYDWPFLQKPSPQSRAIGVSQMHKSSRKTNLPLSLGITIGKTTLRACPALIEYLGSPLDRLQAYLYA